MDTEKINVGASTSKMKSDVLYDNISNKTSSTSVTSQESDTTKFLKAGSSTGFLPDDRYDAF